MTTPETTPHPALTATPRPITAPVERTSGKAKAPTIMRKIPVTWELDLSNGVTTAAYIATPGKRTPARTAGRVIESIPGKLYHFETRRDAERGDTWGMFGSPERAAEEGAVRFVLDAVAYP